MKARLRTVRSPISGLPTYKINRLESRNLPIDRNDWIKACDRIDEIFWQGHGKVTILQFISCLPAFVTILVGLAIQYFLLIGIGMSLFILWNIFQCCMLRRFRFWLDKQMEEVCQDLTSSDSNNGDVSFSFVRIGELCGCDVEYFMLILPSSECVTVACSDDFDDIP
mmetsp:Transcript_27806/g.31776  ORF Transcript_27806/g.31776 Transcript_27806/m.31776 type:complete len:167 (-) Transcript_27806:316-816(-)